MKTPFFALCIFLFSTVTLYYQAPFFFHDMRSADTVYHAAKIARTMEGDPFVDPFSGTKTLYPPLFHLLGAKTASFLGYRPETMIHVFGITTHILLSLSLFVLGYAVFQDIKKAALFYLLFSLIVYAPATKYHLLQGPATLSHPFVFFGMAFILFFWTHKNNLNLYLGAFFLGLACQLWWFNLFFAVPFLSISLFHFRSVRPLFFFVLPFLFTAYHLYSVKEILPFYGSSGEKIPFSFIGTFFLRGQGDYLETLPPWKWNYDPYFSPLKTARDVINFLFFFALSLPGSLFLFFSSFYLFFKKNLTKQTSTLFLCFLAAFLFSALLQIVGNSAHLYRVQLYSHTLLLLFVLATLPSFKFQKTALFLGGFFTLWHVLHNPMTILQNDFVKNEDKEAVSLLKTLSSNERIFFTDTSYRALIFATPFYSLVGNKDGRYYFQDPVSAKAMKEGYLDITRLKNANTALNDFAIKYLGFNKQDPAEKILLKAYLPQGDIVFENAKWTLLKKRT